MQEAVRRVLGGERCKTVARELGVPESTVRYNVAKLRRPIPIPDRAQIAAQEQGARAQSAAQPKTQITPELDPLGWLRDARIVQAWLIRELSKKLQGSGLTLRDLVVTFGVVTDKIHQADVLLRPVAEAQATATAQAVVVLKVQQGEGEVVDLVEFIGSPPQADETPISVIGPVPAFPSPSVENP